MAGFTAAIPVIIDTDGDSFITDMTAVSAFATGEPNPLGGDYHGCAWWRFEPGADGSLSINFGLNSRVSEPDSAGFAVYTTGVDTPGFGDLTEAGSWLSGHTVSVTGGLRHYIQGVVMDLSDTLQGVFTGAASSAFGPIVVLDPFDATVIEGRTARFHSIGAGRPAPAVQWQWHEA